MVAEEIWGYDTVAERREVGDLGDEVCGDGGPAVEDQDVAVWRV